MMSNHQIGARLLFVGGLAFIWWMFGPMGIAGAGMLILIVVFAREIEISGRQKQTAQEHWQPIQSPSQPHD